MSWQADFAGRLAVIKEYIEIDESEFEGNENNFYSEDDAIELLEQCAKKFQELHIKELLSEDDDDGYIYCPNCGRVKED